MISNETLIALYESCRHTNPNLFPNPIREALIKCASENGDEPSHSEDDPTPEALLYEAAEKITGLLENLGHFDSDGMEPLPEWSECEAFAANIQDALQPRGSRT